MTAAPVPGPGAGSTQRERIIAAAAELTASTGWSSVTMSRLADAVGVSRQTVYNEIGSKPALAEAMVLAELGTFLTVVDRAFDRHPHDLAQAVRAATHDVLDLARGNSLIREIVSAAHGAGTDLLPLLATRSGSVLSTAEAAIARRVRQLDLPLPAEQAAVLVDVVVRFVLSHVMQPSGTPAETADGLAALVRRILAT